MRQEVTLKEILGAREARVLRQNSLLKRHGSTVISFTLNISGPVKRSPLIYRTFREGKKQLKAGLTAAKLSILEYIELRASTGYEALYAVEGTAWEVKRLCVSIENDLSLGRLFDLDVLEASGRKLDRSEIGASPRGCLVCGALGRDCASRRIHTVQELQATTQYIMETYFAAVDQKRISALVTKALLDEVCITPKPGLVDRSGNSSHQDMDIFTFNASAAALSSYWGECFRTGLNTASCPPSDSFHALRRIGKAAEREMFLATGGINTHKGAIFTLSLICGSLGRLWRAEAPCRNAERILAECAAIAGEEVRKEFAVMGWTTAHTPGERLYLEYGLTGVRGEAAQGFPGISKIALPALKRALSTGRSRNDAGAIALLHLIAKGADTNMVSRGGIEQAETAAKRCAQLVERNSLPSPKEIEELDLWFVQRNISPGGCADLLAATLFLEEWESAN